MTILEEAQALLVAQTQKGIAKYGQTLDDAGLSLVEMLTHQSEELADALQYTLMARRAALEMETMLAAWEEAK